MGRRVPSCRICAYAAKLQAALNHGLCDARITLQLGRRPRRRRRLESWPARVPALAVSHGIGAVVPVAVLSRLEVRLCDVLSPAVDTVRTNNVPRFRICLAPGALLSAASRSRNPRSRWRLRDDPFAAGRECGGRRPSLRPSTIACSVSEYLRQIWTLGAATRIVPARPACVQTMSSSVQREELFVAAPPSLMPLALAAALRCAARPRLKNLN